MIDPTIFLYLHLDLDQAAPYQSLTRLASCAQLLNFIFLDVCVIQTGTN